MNIVYDPDIKRLLCPKCRGLAHWDNKGNLECEWELCGYVYIMGAKDKKVNIFQRELFDD